MLLLKVIMCVFNGMIFLAGGVAAFVGILVEVNSKYLREVLDNIKDSPPALAQLANVGYLLIAVGAVLAIMGFVGCCGALSESKCMLLTLYSVMDKPMQAQRNPQTKSIISDQGGKHLSTAAILIVYFFITVLIVFLAEVAGAVFVLLFQPMAQKLLDGIRVKVAQSIKSNYGENEVLTTAWNETMNLMKCCGYNDYSDFTDSPFVKRTVQYPASCCNGKPTQCTWGTARTAHIMGCFDSLLKLVEDNSVLLAGVAISIAAIEVCAMTVSILLYKN